MTAFTFAPQGWMICDGSVLQISQYPSLFAAIGDTFGGDGHTTFAIPDLRGRTPLCDSQAQGGVPTFTIGQSGGSETVVLTSDQLPQHYHYLMANSGNATEQSPAGNIWAAEATGQFPCYYSTYRPTNPGSTTEGTVGTMSASALQSTGGGGAHPNMQPYLVINYCICASGNIAPRA